jgi:hypothetical protein
MRANKFIFLDVSKPGRLRYHGMCLDRKGNSQAFTSSLDATAVFLCDISMHKITVTGRGVTCCLLNY